MDRFGIASAISCLEDLFNLLLKLLQCVSWQEDIAQAYGEMHEVDWAKPSLSESAKSSPVTVIQTVDLAVNRQLRALEAPVDLFIDSYRGIETKREEIDAILPVLSA
jgi:hypothetical protein